MHYPLNYNDVNRATDTWEGLQKFLRGINGAVGQIVGLLIFILLFPLLLLFVTILFLLVKSVIKKGTKTLESFINDIQQTPPTEEAFDEVRRLYRFVSEQKDRVTDLVDDMPDGHQRKFLDTFIQDNRRYLAALSKAEASLESHLYVKHVGEPTFSAEEAEEWREFFGSDEQYEKDTFIQNVRNAKV